MYIAFVLTYIVMYLCKLVKFEISLIYTTIQNFVELNIYFLHLPHYISATSEDWLEEKKSLIAFTCTTLEGNDVFYIKSLEETPTHHGVHTE